MIHPHNRHLPLITPPVNKVGNTIGNTIGHKKIGQQIYNFPDRLIFFKGVRGTPRTLLDPPRHFKKHKRFRFVFDESCSWGTLTAPQTHPRWSQTTPTNVKNMSNICQNFGSEPWTKPLGYGRWLDSSKPLLLALRRALRGFFFGKKGV